jgi:hypothetical protein
MKEELLQLLRHRESVIADHAWRDRDPSDHLEALKKVSGDIAAWTGEHGAAADGKLRHYLANASFAKAIAHLEAESRN